MEQVIYGDVLFAVNFSMDFLSLYVTGRILRDRQKPLRLSAAAASGALYGTAAVFLPLEGLLAWGVNAAAALLICFIAFGRGSVGLLMRRTAVFYGISFLLGGAMTALYTFLGKRLGERRVIADGSPATLNSSIPLAATVALAAAAGTAALIVSRVLRGRRTREPAELEIAVGGRSVKLSALCDSGNLASEPLGGLPVVFIRADKLKRLFPEADAEAMIAGKPEGLSRLSPGAAKRIRIVPLSTVAGKRSGIGFIPDAIRIGGTEKRACVVPGDGPFGDEDALIPEILLK